MTITIQDASARETEQLGAFVQEAFATARVSDGHERELLEQIRGDERYVPDLEVVAVEDGRVVGYAMASATTIAEGDRTWPALYLGPICTREDRRDAGLGSMLVHELLTRAERLGHGSMFLAGDTAYYPRFGFKAASAWGIRCQYDIPPELLDNIMWIEITPGGLDGVTGVVTF